MAIRAEGEWAVVVGATGALGGAITRRLRRAGLPVLAVARSADALARLTDEDPGITACPADIGAAGSVDAIRNALDGPVRMVVQAIGLPPAGPLATVDPAAYGAGVSLKVGGLLRLVRAVEDRLAPGSRIVALGGHFGSEPEPHATGAGVVNAALANLVRQLADDLGSRGVTVHLLAPGPVDTARLRGLSASVAERRGVSVDAVLDEHRAASPLGTLVTAEQVAWAATLLLDPEADALHGATLALDAGARRGLF